MAVAVEAASEAAHASVMNVERMARIIVTVGAPLRVSVTSCWRLRHPCHSSAVVAATAVASLPLTSYLKCLIGLTGALVGAKLGMLTVNSTSKMPERCF